LIGIKSTFLKTCTVFLHIIQCHYSTMTCSSDKI
jgi:hypothetical protein